MSSERRWRHGIGVFEHTVARKEAKYIGVKNRACLPLPEGWNVIVPWVGGERGEGFSRVMKGTIPSTLQCIVLGESESPVDTRGIP